MTRADAREHGITEENRWLPQRFYGFNIDDEVWRREATVNEGLGIKAFGSSDFRTGIDWEATLSAWEQAGLVFDWNRDSKRARTGFIHRNTLLNAEGRLLELRQHKPEAPDD